MFLVVRVADVACESLPHARSFPGWRGRRVLEHFRWSLGAGKGLAQRSEVRRSLAVGGVEAIVLAVCYLYMLQHDIGLSSKVGGATLVCTGPRTDS